MKTRNLYIILLLMALLSACRDVYYPDELNKGKKIPVIQGQIQLDTPPMVVLSYAITYSDVIPEYISNAVVTVSDKEGNSVTLAENDPGHYEANFGEMDGEIGNSYQLHVMFEDGTEFESKPEILPQTPEIDSLYADPTTHTFVKYNQFGAPITEEQVGLFIYSSLSAHADSTLYFRFNTSVVKESTYILYPQSPSSRPVFRWETDPLDYVYSVDKTVKLGDMQVRPGHSVGFLRYLYDPTLSTRLATAPITVGWVVTFKVFSISSDVHDYYQSIANQLSSSDQMFAPVPSQVKSNIRCITDPGQPLIGVFEASSYQVMHKAFRWVTLDLYQYKQLDSFPSGLKDGEKMYLPPDFWVNFN